MSKVSRRQTLGLGLGAGVSVTMLAGGQDEALAAPAGVTFTLLLVNDIYKVGDDQGARRLRRSSRRSSRPSGRAGVPDAVLPCRRQLLALADVGLRPGRAHRALTNMIKPDVFVPGNHEFDFGKDDLFQAHGRGHLPLLRRQYAPGRRHAGARHDRPPPLSSSAPSRSASSASRSPRRRQMSQPGDLDFHPELDTLRREAATLRAAGADIVVAVAHTDREMDYAIVRSRARRRAAVRPRPRPRHRL